MNSRLRVNCELFWAVMLATFFAGLGCGYAWHYNAVFKGVDTAVCDDSLTIKAMDACKIYDVDPYLFYAVWAHETGYGKVKIGPALITSISDEIRQAYQDDDRYIYEMAHSLRRYQSKYTPLIIRAMGREWAEDKNWHKGVVKIYKDVAAKGYFDYEDAGG